ncbi:MAG: 1-phosphofructokinase family hexose kinase [Fimbriimonadaceae bacterium]|nr:1-phosphofructokinase family hexose kinase [Fimbriimonadaceae bacterium]
MILTVTLNPCVDLTLNVDGLKPHDTNRVTSCAMDAGGKGVNLSRVAVELGADSIATGFVGGANGAKVRYVLDEQGVVCGFVQTESETRVNYSVESGDGAPTTFNTRGGEIRPHEWERLVAALRHMSSSASWVCFGGSTPPGVPDDATIQLADIAREAGAKVLVDADGAALRRAMEFKPDLVKPNTAEAGRLLGREIKSLDEAVMAARELVGQLAAGGVAIISRGGDGAVLATTDRVLESPGAKVEVKSTIGSGDSLLGGFLAGLTSGKDLVDSFRLGLAAGAATAMTDSTEIARRQTVEDLLPHIPVSEVL